MYFHGLENTYDKGTSKYVQKASTHIQESSDSVFHKGHAVEQNSLHATVH